MSSARGAQIEDLDITRRGWIPHGDDDRLILFASPVGHTSIVLDSKVVKGGVVNMQKMLESIEARCDVRTDVGHRTHELSTDKFFAEILIHGRGQLHIKFKFAVNKSK